MGKKNFVKEENGIRYFNDGNYIDLSELNRIKKGNKLLFDWKSSKNKHVCVKFEGNKYIFYIKDYTYNEKNKHIIFEYNNNMYNMSISSFYNCCFNNVINNSLDYRYNEGDIINNLKILKRIRIKTKGIYNNKGYTVKCIKDCYTFDVLEGRIDRNVGCHVCLNKK